MKQLFVASLLLMFPLFLSPAHAVTYSWTDEAGTIHFTEDMGTVPESLRNKVTIVGEAENSPEETPSAKEPAARATAAAPATVQSGGSADDRAYADRSRDEWQKELTEREAAMTAVRARIDEIAARLKGFSGEWDEQKKLLQEYNGASARLKEMRAAYFQLVERARKSGFTVDIRE